MIQDIFLWVALVIFLGLSLWVSFKSIIISNFPNKISNLMWIITSALAIIIFLPKLIDYIVSDTKIMFVVGVLVALFIFVMTDEKNSTKGGKKRK